MAKYSDYRKGGDGFVLWAEDHINVELHPVGSTIPRWFSLKDLPKEKHPLTGRSYRYLWEQQKNLLLEALQMVNNNFIHRLIVFCWMRGDGKSLLAVLVQLWKFFCFPSQHIVFCANSKDQTDWVHYSIARNLILHSPTLINRLGKKNIKEKAIEYRDKDNNIISSIRKISSFSGIVSNITGYSFSEIHEMKKPAFFTQIDGSIRNIPNALGIIDTTVSPEVHQLYALYQAHLKHADPTLFFSYRNSPKSSHEDFWHPMMTKQQLDSYQAKFLFGEFEKYFMNMWSAGAENVFDKNMIELIGYLGIKKHYDSLERTELLIAQKIKIMDQVEAFEDAGVDSHQERKLTSIEEQLWRVEDEYKLYPREDDDGSKFAVTAGVEQLEKMGDLLDTDWAILAGLDRADPMKQKRTNARSIVSGIAKGLPGSLTNPQLANVKAPNYIYLLIYLQIVADHSIEGIKNGLDYIIQDYDGIDRLCAERWGAWDLTEWAEDRETLIELIYPTYDRQKESFTEMYNAVKSHRFKSPPVPLAGSSGKDLLREEMNIFDHDTEKHKFGSPQKTLKAGIQDDCLYSITWTIYGGRLMTIDEFRPRRSSPFFGHYSEGEGNLGRY